VESRLESDFFFSLAPGPGYGGCSSSRVDSEQFNYELKQLISAINKGQWLPKVARMRWTRRGKF
jgi:hypothetical protein